MAKRTRKKQKNPLDKQAFLVFSAILVFLAALILTPTIYHQIFEKFEYAGIPFEKTKAGQVVFYHGVYPIVYQGKVYTNYNMYLRTDPRKNDVPMEVNLSLSPTISISIAPEIMECKSAILGQSLVGQFFNVFPWVKQLNTTTNDEEFAKQQNWSYASCKNASEDHTVFIVQESENTSIVSGEKENCFVINVANCEYLEAMERLVVGGIAQINGIKI